MSGRARILEDIRSGLGRGALEDAARHLVDARNSPPPTHVRPRIDDEDLVTRFAQRFESRAGKSARIASRNDVPATVAALADEFDLPHRAMVGAGVGKLRWPKGWQIDHGAAGIDATLGVSCAFLGIAETGTVMMLSGPDSPITHNFVPETHVVVVDADRIVRHFEDGWVKLRERGEGAPRTINFIAGPSRTGDVEQTIELGAHGPRRMHVLIVG